MAKRQTALRLEEEQLAKIEALATEEKRTPAAMVRILLDEALEARGKDGQTLTADERRVVALVASGVDYAVPLADATGWSLPRCWSVLHGLEQRGLLASREEPGGEDRGGRPRTRYVVRWADGEVSDAG